MIHSHKCIRKKVPGAPYQPGRLVVVIDAIDQDIHDVSRFIGMKGQIEHLDYDCGVGQHYPDDPSIGVRFPDGTLEEFWREELEPARRR